ncbi:MAG: rhomboid family intramembrane serine protease [Woeseia sp.]|nr:rhomboid family intramembrane serine protease [Woeseia sp.]MBT8096133.1 rhomboid family intramembrane serine protease [Woeseia sp.]NNE60398.1 rhomboid family intramembrane serine protease [Woeseia sp.]NNL53797.1 rhomboid family intramembrane serine protease [Woeseia sp.]
MLQTPGATAILVVTIAISLLGMYRMPQIVERSLFRPYYFLRARHYETIFTSGFVHADLGHLLFNMVTFFFFGFSLESRIGTWKFILLYAVGLVLSHSCSYFKHRDNQHYASLGASGAVSAVLFAYIVYFPDATLMIIPIPIPIPAVLFAFGYVAYSWWAAQQARGRINHDAHFCGALSGLAFVAGTDPDAFRRLLSIVL